MDGNHPKNKDLRPKRRKDRDNPYAIFTSGSDTDSPHYYLAFTDSQEIRHCMEIDRELFDTLNRFELAPACFCHFWSDRDRMQFWIVVTVEQCQNLTGADSSIQHDHCNVIVP